MKTPTNNIKITDEDIEATIKNSNKMLNGFNPYEKGVMKKNGTV